MCEWVTDTLGASLDPEVSVVRRGYPESQSPEPPRVVYIPIEPTESIEGDARVYTGTMAIRIDSNRDIAFGSGDNPEHAGGLHTLEDEVDALLSDAVPTLAGHTARALKRVGVRDGDSTEQVSARTLLYNYTIYEGFGGVPLAGDEGSLTLSGYDGKVFRWQADDRAPINADDTGRDDAHPQYCLGDNTASLTVWMYLEEGDIPLPSLGGTTATFEIHSGATWSETIKIYRRQWGQKPGDNDAVVLVLHAVLDDAASPFLTGVIP